MSKLTDLPPFLREAFEDEGEPEAFRLAESLELEVASQLGPVAPSPEGLSRLMRALEHPPGRYAPFYSRIAELFELSEAATISELSRLAKPGVWRFAGWPGVHSVTVQGGGAVANAETLFVRFAQGTRFPRHRHTGAERILVLEGEYSDSLGVVHRAGELREWPAGSEHAFRVGREEACILASVVFGREFHSPPLRFLARLLGR